MISSRSFRLLAIALSILTCLFVLPAIPASAAVSYTAVQGGDWDEPATWGGSVPPLGTDTVIVQIPAGISVIVPADLTVEFTDDSLFVSGSLFSGGTLVAQPGTFIEIANGGELFNFGSLDIDTGLVNGTFLQSTLQNLGSFVNTWDFTLHGLSNVINRGTMRNNGEIQMSGVFSEIDNRLTGTFENRGIVENYAAAPPSGNRGRLLNRGGTVLNTSSGLFKLGGSLTNTDSGLIQNYGTIDVMNDNQGHRGTLVNGGSGSATIDNFGIIEAASSTGNSNVGNDNLLFRNRSGGEIRIPLNHFFILSGRLVNESGGTIKILAPHGTLQNRRIIDNDGLIENGNVFDNTGSGILIVRCNSSITGNTVQGNAPRDYCDSVPPTITVPSPITAEATGPTGAPITYVVNTRDDKDPFPSLDCSGFPTSAFDTVFPLGTTTVTCSSTDRVGNTSSASFTVTVVDTTPPEITALGPLNVVVVQNTTYSDAGATASDLVDGDVTSSLTVNNPVDTAVPGFYQITYEVSDSRSNHASVTRSVEVITPREAVDRLIAHVEGLSISEATREDLLRPLNRSSELLQDGRAANDRGVCRLLNVFARTVDSHESHGNLTGDQATELNDRATAIKTGLGC